MAALAGQGIAMPSVLLVEAERPAERLWAAEQALRCRDLSALLVWLPQARPEQLRRLQLACQAAHQPRPPLAFVFRPQSAQHESSPAPLRLSLRLSPWQETPGAGQQASSELEVHIFKRRGPVQETPLRLHTALPPVLALRRAAAVAPSVASPVRVTSSAEQASPASAAIVALPIAFTGTPHVVDRARAPADSVQARA
jgi:protein ImuA